MADAYAVEQGYGKPLRDSLIRGRIISLTTEVKSLDYDLTIFEQYHIQKRLDNIKELLK